MFITGHLSGAYLALKPFQRHLPRHLFAAGLVGGVLPDIDMLWFHFVDHGAFHHHEYLTHRPLLWVIVLLTGAVLCRMERTLGLTVLILGVGGLVHMALDTIAGAIAWGWPLDHTPNTLVVVQATHSHWILSFLNHWTFQVEILMTTVALFLLWRSKSAPH